MDKGPTVKPKAAHARRTAEGKPYDGPLAEPMSLPTMLSSPTEISEWAATRARKCELLFKHFGIDPSGQNAWRDLAIALADQHVPGFQPPPEKQGRPRKRQHDDLTLLMLVELLKRRDGLSVRAATKKIAAAHSLPGTWDDLRARHKKALKDKHFAALQHFLGSVPDLGGIKSLEHAVGHRLHPKRPRPQSK